MPARQVEIATDQRVDGAKVVGVDLQHTVVNRDRRFWSIEHVFFDRSRLEERVSLLLRLLKDHRLSLENDREVLVLLQSFQKGRSSHSASGQAERVNLEDTPIQADRP